MMILQCLSYLLASTSRVYGKVGRFLRMRKTPFHPFPPMRWRSYYGLLDRKELSGEAYHMFAASGYLVCSWIRQGSFREKPLRTRCTVWLACAPYMWKEAVALKLYWVIIVRFVIGVYSGLYWNVKADLQNETPELHGVIYKANNIHAEFAGKLSRLCVTLVYWQGGERK